MPSSDAQKQEAWIGYEAAVKELAAALPRWNVDHPADVLAELMLRHLLEGRLPDSSTAIRYLDAMFAIVDGLHVLKAETSGEPYEDVAEQILLPILKEPMAPQSQ